MESNGTPSVAVSRLRSPSEDVSVTKWTTLPERMKRASKESRRSLTSSQGKSGADAMERKRNEVRASPAHREWRAALLWPQGL